MAGLLAVAIENLWYRYPNGAEALRGVSLEVKVGETLCLLGPNGAGKSTLLLHLNGLLRGQGRVCVLGEEVGGCDLAALRRRVGMVFENPNDQLIMPTVRDEVAFAALNAGYPRAEVERRTAAALERLALGGLEQRCPQDLSLGQKKRVALASVLVTDCELLVLDEPTGALDPWAREQALALLGGLGPTRIIATHDLELVRRVADRVALLWEGRVREVGHPEEVLAGLPGEVTAAVAPGQDCRGNSLTSARPGRSGGHGQG